MTEDLRMILAMAIQWLFDDHAHIVHQRGFYSCTTYQLMFNRN